MDAVAIVGMAAGSILILSAAAIFWSKKEFPAGGVAITLVAVVLIGMSQWSHFKFKFGEAELEAVREQVRQTAAATEQIAAEAENAVMAVESTRKQLGDVVDQLQKARSLSADAAQPIRRQLADAPKLDIRKLSMARADLTKIIQQKKQ